MSRSRSTARGFLAAASLVALVAPWGSAAPVGAQVDPGRVELAAVTLTTDDLAAAGLEGFGVDIASVYPLVDDVDYLSEFQGLDPEEIEEVLVDAGHVASYTTVQRQPADEIGAEASTPTTAQVQTTVYLFVDAEGAEAAYELIADESDAPAEGGDVAGELEDLGDASELTALAYDDEDRRPATHLELEILADDMVLEVKLIEYPGETDRSGEPVVEPDDVAVLEELGGRMLARADAARDGETPGLAGQVVVVRSDVERVSFVSYDLMNGDPLRFSGEDDAGFEDRVEGERDRGFVSVLRSEQFLTNPDDRSEQLRLYDTLIAFEDEDAADAYIDGVAERLGSSGGNTRVDEVDSPRLGDDTVALEIEREDPDGEPFVVYQLFVRVGATVGVLLVQETVGDAGDAVVPLETLVELGEAQAGCLEEGACDGPVAAPDGLSEIVDGGPLGPTS